MKLRLLLAGLLALMTSLAHANDLSEWKPLLPVTELHKLLEDDPFAATVVDIRALDSKDPEASYNAGHGIRRVERRHRLHLPRAPDAQRSDQGSGDGRDRQADPHVIDCAIAG